MANNKFRKKPVEIEAFRYGIDARSDWFQDKVTSNDIITNYPDHHGSYHNDTPYCEIKTLEGVMRGEMGDYIIQGVNGEIYPCKPDIFEKTYDKIEY